MRSTGGCPWLRMTPRLPPRLAFGSYGGSRTAMLHPLSLDDEVAGPHGRFSSAEDGGLTPFIALARESDGRRQRLFVACRRIRRPSARATGASRCARQARLQEEALGRLGPAK